MFKLALRWACPSQKEGDGLQAYQAFVLLQKIVQHQSDCRTAYVVHSSTNRTNQIDLVHLLAS